MSQTRTPARAAAGTAPSASQTACPCGGQPPGATYAACCARLIETRQAAPDALTLMRSRYTAYVYDNFDYLRSTWHPRTCPPDLADAGDNRARPHWLGLSIKRHTAIDEDHAEVEFVARYKIGGRAQRLHEISRFTRIEGRWRYLDGQLFD